MKNNIKMNITETYVHFGPNSSLADYLSRIISHVFSLLPESINQVSVLHPSNNSSVFLSAHYFTVMILS